MGKNPEQRVVLGNCACQLLVGQWEATCLSGGHCIFGGVCEVELVARELIEMTAERVRVLGVFPFL